MLALLALITVALAGCWLWMRMALYVFDLPRTKPAKIIGFLLMVWILWVGLTGEKGQREVFPGLRVPLVSQGH